MSKPSADSIKAVTETIQALFKAAANFEGRQQTERREEKERLSTELTNLQKEIPKDAGGENVREWQQLSEADAAKLSARLSTLRDQLSLFVDGDGPSHPDSHIMRRAYATSWIIYLMTAVGLAGSVVTLREVANRWEAAMGEVGPTEEAPPPPAPMIDGGAPHEEPVQAAAAPPLSASATPRPARASERTAASRDGGATVLAQAMSADPPAPPPRPAASTAPVGVAPSSPPPAPLTASDVEKIVKQVRDRKHVPESTILVMVILLGTLGGFLHWTSSLGKYVGNRALMRSWIIWYLLMPISGATLAPAVYLLWRVGVLANSTDHLNLLGIYAFSLLAGLFAEHALEMLSKTFQQLFARIDAKDSLDGKNAGT
jgi:hypothetical protein